MWYRSVMAIYLSRPVNQLIPSTCLSSTGHRWGTSSMEMAGKRDEPNGTRGLTPGTLVGVKCQAGGREGGDQDFTGPLNNVGTFPYTIIRWVVSSCPLTLKITEGTKKPCPTLLYLFCIKDDYKKTIWFTKSSHHITCDTSCNVITYMDSVWFDLSWLQWYYAGCPAVTACRCQLAQKCLHRPVPSYL